MKQGQGASSGEDRATHEQSPQAVSAVPVGIPSAGALPNICYLSCPLCFGTRETSLGRCSHCLDPDLKRVRWMLARLQPSQVDFLRAFEHTLAEQPVTSDEWDAHQCEFYVEDRDGEYDEEADYWIIPNTKHWFASARVHSGPVGNGSFIRYNPAGLLLRDCLMCGSTADVPHMYPPRHAQAIDAPKDQSPPYRGGRQ